MAKICMQSPIVPLEVEIGEAVVTGRMNLAPARLAVIGKAAMNTARELELVEGAKRAAADSDDLDAYMSAEKDIAAKIEPLIKSVLGDKFYQDILTACGGGEPLEPEECNEVTYKIMWAIADAVGQRKPEAQQSYEDKLAAHYLEEVSDALQSPNADQPA